MTTCTYRGSYTDPPNNSGVCVSTSVVLEGCPIYVVGPVDFEARIEPLLNGVTPPVTTIRDLGSSEELFHTTDVYSCDCPATSIPTAFGRYELLIDTREGDVITFAGGGHAVEDTITVIAAGPCPGPAWPTAYVGATACDLCPSEPVENGKGGGGCSAANGGGLLAFVLVLAIARDRRSGARLAQQRAVGKSVV